MKTPERFGVKISKSEKERYHQELLELKNSGPKDKFLGICWNAQIPEDVIGALSANWPKFSGNEKYPVPSGKKDIHPVGAFQNTDDLWNKRTKYGRLRRELLDFLIEATKPEDK